MEREEHVVVQLFQTAYLCVMHLWDHNVSHLDVIYSTRDLIR
jgi:hypothetical protein